MYRPIVPPPRDVFSDFSDHDFELLSEHSDQYVCQCDQTGQAVFFLVADYRVCFLIYYSGQTDITKTFSELQHRGYVLCWSEQQVRSLFCKLSGSFRSQHMSMMFDQEYHYYAYL